MLEDVVSERFAGNSPRKLDIESARTIIRKALRIRINGFSIN